MLVFFGGWAHMKSQVLNHFENEKMNHGFIPYTEFAVGDKVL